MRRGEAIGASISPEHCRFCSGYVAVSICQKFPAGAILSTWTDGAAPWLTTILTSLSLARDRVVRGSGSPPVTALGVVTPRTTAAWGFVLPRLQPEA